MNITILLIVVTVVPVMVGGSFFLALFHSRAEIVSVHAAGRVSLSCARVILNLNIFTFVIESLVIPTCTWRGYLQVLPVRL
jgi:hypothetical protein